MTASALPAHYSILDVARALGVSTRTVHRAIAAGRLEAVRTGPERGRIRIAEDALRRYLERQRVR